MTAPAAPADQLNRAEKSLSPRALARVPLDAPHTTSLPDPSAQKALVYTPDEIGEIAASPGVYLMRDRDDDIIYVGKSVNLKQRVRAYFQEQGDGRLNAHFLRRRIRRVETITTRSEREALLLEISLIQHYRPRYNFRLTDDKSFFSIKLNRSKAFPRLEFVRTRAAQQDRARNVEFFGPYHSTDIVKRTISELLRIFQLRSCTDHVMANRTRPCVLHEIGKCCAPCVDLITPEDYAKLVDGARRFLQGRTREVIELLRTQMMEHSEALEYEKAARVRDQITAIERASEQQSAQEAVVVERDVVVFLRRGGRLLFLVLHYRGGGLADTTTYFEKDPEEPDEDVARQFLMQFYGSGVRQPPSELLLGSDPGNRDELAEILTALRGAADGRARVKIQVPQRGSRREPVDLAIANAEQAMERELAGEKSREATLAGLADRLNLPAPPRHIECFDISTFQGSSTVGVMVCFREAEPAKGEYRKFVVRNATQQPDDFAAMREVLERRYRRVLEEGGALPDLILIDGGKGQLRQAIEVARELGLHEVPLAAIAKSRLKTPKDAPSDVRVRSQERIFLPGRANPVTFRSNAPELFLLQRVRDETHRFAITFHRKRRSRRSLQSALDDVPGIGPKRRAALLRTFGSVAAIRAASAEELRERGKLPEATANQLRAHLDEQAAAQESTGSEPEGAKTD